MYGFSRVKNRNKDIHHKWPRLLQSSGHVRLPLVLNEYKDVLETVEVDTAFSLVSCRQRSDVHIIFACLLLPWITLRRTM